MVAYMQICGGRDLRNWIGGLYNWFTSNVAKGFRDFVDQRGVQHPLTWGLCDKHVWMISKSKHLIHTPLELLVQTCPIDPTTANYIYRLLPTTISKDMFTLQAFRSHLPTVTGSRVCG